MTVEAPAGSYDVQASHGAVADGGHGGHNLGYVFHSLGPCTPDGGAMPAEHIREVEATEFAGEGQEGGCCG